MRVSLAGAGEAIGGVAVECALWRDWVRAAQPDAFETGETGNVPPLP